MSLSWAIGLGLIAVATIAILVLAIAKLPKTLAADYDRAIDRQINKARGILPFNSVIIAVLGIQVRQLTDATEILPSKALFGDLATTICWPLVFDAAAFLGVSSILCLWLFDVEQGNEDDPGRRRVVAFRAPLLEGARTTSIAGFLTALLLILFANLHFG